MQLPLAQLFMPRKQPNFRALGFARGRQPEKRDGYNRGNGKNGSKGADAEDWGRGKGGNSDAGGRGKGGIGGDGGRGKAANGVHEHSGGHEDCRRREKDLARAEGLWRPTSDQARLVSVFNK